jgi:carboxylesterase
MCGNRCSCSSPIAFATVSHPIMQGAEPFARPGGPGGALVLHGFTGNPQSMRPLAEALANEGLAVGLPLLPGHGTDPSDLVDKTWADWSEAADGALHDLEARCENVVVVGLSVGGSLTCWLAERHPEIRGIAVVNPMVEPPAQSFRDVVRGLLDTGEEYAPGVGSDIAKPGQTELAYSGTPLRAALSLFEGLDELAAGLQKISCPALVITSRQDHVVPPSSSDLLVASVSGPVEHVILEKSYHVATLDYDAEEITDRIVRFALGHVGANGSDR